MIKKAASLATSGLWFASAGDPFEITLLKVNPFEEAFQMLAPYGVL